MNAFPPFGVRVTRALETGVLRSPITEALSRPWASLSEPVRPLRLPAGVRVFGVSGPTLGGSYKTPTVIALATALASRGISVAVVSHAYGARPGAARIVRADDSVARVGDDALATACALGPLAVPVVVASRREDAVRLAAKLSPNVVVDGLLQAAPRRLALSMLVVSASRPWGAGSCPPAGDLRAPRERLLAASDVTLWVRDAPEETPGALGGRDVGASWVLDAAVSEDGTRTPLEALRGRRIGVVLAVSHGERVRRSLERRGVAVAEERHFVDHAVPRERRRSGGSVDLWLTTPKCATKLGDRFEGAPVRALAGSVALPDELVDRALALAVDGARR